ncbi:MAG: DUF192 domain-containing protein [Bacillota bacterium]
MESRVDKSSSHTIANLSLGTVLAGNVMVATSFWTRFKGLLGRTSLPLTDALLLKECGSVHTFFMRFAIDVAYLDRDMTVVAIHPNVRPWRIVIGTKGGVHTLEMAGGAFALAGLRVGHRLEVRSK